MHTFRARACLLLVIAGLLLAWSGAASAFRCGNELVREGDRKYDVRRACGHPDYVEKEADAYLEGLGYVGVREVWYYDPGGNAFVRRLTFREGRLSHIETVGRSGSATGGCDPHFIDEGLDRYQLLSECGEPSARDSWEEFGRFRVGRHEVISGKVTVEEWVYDFGPQHFVRYVRIIDGRVVEVELGDRGRP
ncbi:DUF2845 domain-containing protein [Ectothiorhodospiraceae bacterium WFHF3C12]|nr:DUF2845 domain-containing protein [Ectothiorhodospiraceae bacterium WFHF3C12]